MIASRATARRAFERSEIKIVNIVAILIIALIIK